MCSSQGLFVVGHFVYFCAESEEFCLQISHVIISVLIEPYHSRSVTKMNFFVQELIMNVKTRVSIEVSALTQPTEILTSVKECEDMVSVGQSGTQSVNSKVIDSHLSE